MQECFHFLALFDARVRWVVGEIFELGWILLLHFVVSGNVATAYQ